MVETPNAAVKFLSFLCHSLPDSSGVSHIPQLCWENISSPSPAHLAANYVLTVFSFTSNISEKPSLTYWTELGIPPMCPNKIL